MPKEKYMKEIAGWFYFFFESDYIIIIGQINNITHFHYERKSWNMHQSETS